MRYPLAGLAWRQMSANRALTGVLGLGIAVAATLLASAPIYARAMADLGLTYAVRDELGSAASSRVQAFSLPLGTREGEALQAAIVERTEHRAGWFHDPGPTVYRLNRFQVVKPGDAGQPFLPLGQPQSVSGYEQRVEVIAGELPRRTNDGVIEVAMGERAARAARLLVGSTFELVDRFDNCEREFPPGMTEAPQSCPNSESVRLAIPARLTALIEPLDAADPYWQDIAPRFFEPVFVVLEDAGATTPMFVEESALREDFGGRYPGYTAEATWVYWIVPEELDRANLDAARADLEALGDELDSVGGFLTSPIEGTLTRFERSASFQQTPLFVLLLEITAIAVFYVLVVGAMVVERQAGEIALLRARGATLGQMLGLSAMQGAVIAVPAALLAPFAAAAATALLGLTPVFEEASGGELLPVTIVPSAFLFAALGGTVSVVALLIPALVAALRGPAGVRRAVSRPGVPFAQRYYLDLALAGVAAILLFELRERGSVFTPSPTGGVSSDPLLLASPALAIVAASMLVLRFYPLVVRGAARATRSTTAPIALGLWQVARNPGQYTRLALLLMMAVAIGTFAASYTRTADRSYSDRANHVAGVDLRLAEASRTSGAAPERLTLEAPGALPGVERVSAVVRTTAMLATAGGRGSTLQVLAVDPAAAGEMLWFRDDYSSDSLAELMDRLRHSPDLPGIEIPAGSTAFTVWAASPDAVGSVTLRVGVRDATGRYGTLELGSLSGIGREWSALTVPLEGGALIFNHVEPLTVVSLLLTGTTAAGSAPALFFDDFTATAPTGGETVIEDFEGPSRWAIFPAAPGTEDSFGLSGESAHGGASAARIALRQGRLDGTRGLYVSGLLTPLPALVSADLLAATGAQQGSTLLVEVGGGTIAPLQVRGTFDLFPTTSAADGPVAVLNRDALLTWTELAHSGFTAQPQVNEAWLTLAPGADEEALRNQLSGPPYRLPNAISRADELAAATGNPLIAASGSGILFAAFLAILVLVAVAVLTSLLAALRRRQVELAVVRSMGLTRRQLLLMLTLEYGIVFVAGTVSGAVLGRFVGERMLSFLEVTQEGRRVEPRFILETEWLVVAGGIAVLLVVFAAGLGVAMRVIAGRVDARALRVEN